MNTEGVDYKNCTSNNVGEILNILGIEAARKSIIYELSYTFSKHSIYVDDRHLGIISDLMTSKGTVYGFQRFGMIKMKDSVFMHSSFERTNDILFDAAITDSLQRWFVLLRQHNLHVLTELSDGAAGYSANPFRGLLGMTGVRV